MFFYSPNARPTTSSLRRPTLTHTAHLNVGHLDTRLSYQIPEILSRANLETHDLLRHLPEELRIDEQHSLPLSSLRHDIHTTQDILDLCASPVSSVFSTSEQRRSSRQQKLFLRRPTISIQDDGKIIIGGQGVTSDRAYQVVSPSAGEQLAQIKTFGVLNVDHVTARWEGVPLNSQSALIDADDGATVITDTIKDDAERQEPKSCPQQTVKYIKILTPHVILVAVLIGYLCLGAWILMLLETRTELLARSRKLVRLTNMMSNFTADSWRILNEAQHGGRAVDEQDWAAAFREWMLSVSEVVDDRRPIRRELNRPDDLANMHNKWTFPTALLYVLTVLTTCGYGEVSVDTDVGKVFAVVFALVGIPLMFITAADIGKFLSETLLKFVSNWNRMTRKIKQWIYRSRHGRRKSMQSSNGNTDTLDILGVDGTEEKTWSFIHAFHFGFNLIVTVGLGDIVVKDYIFLSLIVAFVIVGLSVVTMCVDLASTHLKAYFTRIHYFGRAKRFLGMSEELKEIVALLGAMRRKKGGKVTWNDVRDFLDNELRDRPFEPHELLMKLRFIDETSSGMSTIRHNSFQSDFFRESEYIRRVQALRPEQPAYL
ncbi:unnamed protein product [Nippostrongylus brasiliensis]|uniref:Uncoordinated protein 58 (inferred by orthology to a C. elegans protein) n=1 Tax=Nippostrongylus brasiliensis TaxID=27835 RepID=A0A158QXC4_NIPBR|nr:unnamed protein product [Nippostrongylus brasiliensis]